MDSMPTNNINLPPGFRFHPSDEELILHYLQNKATSSPLPASIIAEIELYKFNPWELPSKALFGEEEWYFFTPRDRKYPNGVRPNRMAGSGFWKATGTDRPIFSSGKGGIGVKKALVFYTGKPPRGSKTDWIMHEYRLMPSTTSTSNSKWKGTMRLDDWVLCRVRQKSSSPSSRCVDRYGQYNESLGNFPQVNKSITTVNTNPNLELLNDTLFKDCPMLPFIFSSDQLELSSLDTFSSTISFEGSKSSINSVSKISSAEEKLGIRNIPSSDSLKSTHKRKALEMNNEQEGFIQPSKKKDESKEDVTSIFSNNATEMGFYDDISEQWSYTTEYQGLNDSVFG